MTATSREAAIGFAEHARRLALACWLDDCPSDNNQRLGVTYRHSALRSSCYRFAINDIQGGDCNHRREFITSLEDKWFSAEV